MAIMEGHEDLKAKEVLSFTSDGCAMVKCGDTAKKYKLFILPGGGLAARPHKPPEIPIDQLVERPKVPVAQRWASVDQAGSLENR